MTHNYLDEMSTEFNLDELIQSPALQAAREDRECIDALIRDLAATRNELGWTQKQLANRMRTSQSTVSEFESGRSDPHLSTLQRYARAVGRRVATGLLVEADNVDFIFEPRTTSRRVAQAKATAESAPAHYSPVSRESRATVAVGA